MNAAEVLARLTAVLDEDERIALGGGERSPNWWTSKNFGGVGGGRVVHPDPDDPEWITSRHTIVYGEGYPLEPEAEHIARFDPARVLRQVARDRKVLARHQPYELDPSIIPFGGIGSRGPFCIGCGHRGNGVGPLPWPCVEIRELIEVYGEKTAEVKA
ncbi:DUF6221 family protein [Nocardia aurea]|uniref:DUF6221 family protein n=1 Tax=Nocardia aurea TaxID=2144174 RepID=UPI0033A1E1B4